jgi:hypothetical protein
MSWIRDKAIRLLCNWNVVIKICSEERKISFNKFKRSPTVDEWIKKRYELASSLGIPKDFIWLSMMGIEYDDENSLKDEEKRYKILTSMLSKGGVVCEQLFEAGITMLQGNQIWNLNLNVDQFRTWNRLCKSLIPDSQSGLSLFAGSFVRSTRTWSQEEICYDTGIVLLKKFLNVNLKCKLTELKDEDVEVDTERLDLLQLGRRAKMV